MRGVNKVILVGHLGRDPEVKYAANGNAIASISVATSERWKDKQGQQQERTEWHRVKAFGRLAEIMGEYLTKGAQVYIEGSIRTDKYTGQDGAEKYATYIVASEMQMLGGKRDDQQQGGRQEQRQRTNERERARSAPPAGDFDDDIPF